MKVYLNYFVEKFILRRFNGGEVHTLKGNSSSPYFEEPHYSVVPAPRYWNTLKPSKVEQNQEDMMGNSISSTDLVNYSNIDYSATQKMMSLSIGPGISHATQTDENDATNFSQMTTSFLTNQNQQINVFNVSLQPNGGPLGITLSGSEDGQKPIVISGMAENGMAANTAQIQIGDTLLAINNENVVGIALSKATKLLQVKNETIELRLSRGVASNNLMTNSIMSMNDKQQSVNNPQALYAEVQRRPLNLLMKADALSNSTNSSRSGSNNSDGQSLKTIHVTLYKDQVYDDYGFSVSDGLYERGVYINRIRSGGPADQVSVLKPYDRIIQVNIIKF